MLLLLGLNAITTGCATYMVDRGRDAADVFTVTVGGGVGAKARIGPANAGLIFQNDKYGLRGGFIGDQDSGRMAEIIPATHDLQLLVIGMEGYEPPPGTAAERKKQFGAESRWPFIHKLAPYRPCPSYYTQVDVVIALGLSVRIGFNAGEFVDFLLGWSAIDIYGDDLEKEQESNQALHGTAGGRADASSGIP